MYFQGSAGQDHEHNCLNPSSVRMYGMVLMYPVTVTVEIFHSRIFLKQEKVNVNIKE